MNVCTRYNIRKIWEVIIVEWKSRFFFFFTSQSHTSFVWENINGIVLLLILWNLWARLKILWSITSGIKIGNNGCIILVILEISDWYYMVNHVMDMSKSDTIYVICIVIGKYLKPWLGGFREMIDWKWKKDELLSRK